MIYRDVYMPSSFKAHFILSVFIICLLTYSNAQARVIALEKRELIDQIIQQTGTAKILPLMTKQLISEILKLLQSKDVNIDENLVALVQKEANTVMYEEFVLSNKFNEIFYELYDEYFTVAQLKTIVTFYDSSAGARLLTVMPQISQRSMALAQEHSKGIGLKVQQRLMKRFDEVEAKMNAQKSETESATND